VFLKTLPTSLQLVLVPATHYELGMQLSCNLPGMEYLATIGPNCFNKPELDNAILFDDLEIQDC